MTGLNPSISQLREVLTNIIAKGNAETSKWGTHLLNLIQPVLQPLAKRMQTNHYVAIAVFTVANGIFLLGLHQLRKNGNELEHGHLFSRIIKRIFIDLVLVGGGAAAYNALLSKATDYRLSYVALTGIALGAIALRLVVQKIETETQQRELAQLLQRTQTHLTTRTEEKQYAEHQLQLVRAENRDLTIRLQNQPPAPPSSIQLNSSASGVIDQDNPEPTNSLAESTPEDHSNTISSSKPSPTDPVAVSSSSPTPSALDQDNPVITIPPIASNPDPLPSSATPSSSPTPSDPSVIRLSVSTPNLPSSSSSSIVEDEHSASTPKKFTREWLLEELKELDNDEALECFIGCHSESEQVTIFKLISTIQKEQLAASPQTPLSPSDPSCSNAPPPPPPLCAPPPPPPPPCAPPPPPGPPSEAKPLRISKSTPSVSHPAASSIIDASNLAEQAAAGRNKLKPASERQLAKTSPDTNNKLLALQSIIAGKLAARNRVMSDDNDKDDPIEETDPNSIKKGDEWDQPENSPLSDKRLKDMGLLQTGLSTGE